jgi:predicted nucleic acid-binding Zn ribbon protein
VPGVELLRIRRNPRAGDCLRFKKKENSAIVLKIMTDEPKRSDFVHIGNIINDVIKQYRCEPDFALKAVWQFWDQAAGETIAQNARPAAFKGKLLIVHVISSAWIHQLQFLKNDLISKLNASLGKPLVEEIKFKIGPVK